jgi:hypothetical protein
MEFTELLPYLTLGVSGGAFLLALAAVIILSKRQAFFSQLGRIPESVKSIVDASESVSAQSKEASAVVQNYLNSLRDGVNSTATEAAQDRANIQNNLNALRTELSQVLPAMAESRSAATAALERQTETVKELLRKIDELSEHAVASGEALNTTTKISLEIENTLRFFQSKLPTFAENHRLIREGIASVTTRQTAMQESLTAEGAAAQSRYDHIVARLPVGYTPQEQKEFFAYFVKRWTASEWPAERRFLLHVMFSLQTMRGEAFQVFFDEFEKNAGKAIEDGEFLQLAQGIDSIRDTVMLYGAVELPNLPENVLKRGRDLVNKIFELTAAKAKTLVTAIPENDKAVETLRQIPRIWLDPVFAGQIDQVISREETNRDIRRMSEALESVASEITAFFSRPPAERPPASFDWRMLQLAPAEENELRPRYLEIRQQLAKLKERWENSQVVQQVFGDLPTLQQSIEQISVFAAKPWLTGAEITQVDALSKFLGGFLFAYEQQLRTIPREELPFIVDAGTLSGELEGLQRLRNTSYNLWAIGHVKEGRAQFQKEKGIFADARKVAEKDLAAHFWIVDEQLLAPDVHTLFLQVRQQILDSVDETVRLELLRMGLEADRVPPGRIEFAASAEPETPAT